MAPRPHRSSRPLPVPRDTPPAVSDRLPPDSVFPTAPDNESEVADHSEVLPGADDNLELTLPLAALRALSNVVVGKLSEEYLAAMEAAAEDREERRVEDRDQLKVDIRHVFRSELQRTVVTRATGTTLRTSSDARRTHLSSRRHDIDGNGLEHLSGLVTELKDELRNNSRVAESSLAVAVQAQEAQLALLQSIAKRVDLLSSVVRDTGYITERSGRQVAGLDRTLTDVLHAAQGTSAGLSTHPERAQQATQAAEHPRD
ncbi:hypothetical protein CALCODRAFT_504930 [Calocera cornea HHB12733]|uniref:Uncharacterized protein n=1 Tax=Calocera cornea HHB12733 TaxID=1353952 RepID=A0A165C4X5_9BASI|nr:hypothetical protein CALCODRAFT_504930 [Calocera cornea HHB12733]